MAPLGTIPLAQLGQQSHELNPRLIADPRVIARLPDSFPPNDRTDVVAILPLTPERYAQAYDFGVFPWREVIEGEVTWHSPVDRGVIRLDKPIKIQDTFRKFVMANVDLDNMRFHLTVDTVFDQVTAEIQAMDRKNRPGQSATWFYDNIAETFRQMHRLGRTHSLEVWDSVTGDLVGGLIITVANGFIAGESMFHRKIVQDGQVVSEVDDAGKLSAYAALILAKQNGFKFFDTQTMKPGSFQSRSGGEMVPREIFLGMVEQGQANPPTLLLPTGPFTIYYEKYTAEDAKADGMPSVMVGQPNKNKPIIIEVVRR
jgi:leucyl/phenylalanyl-tRNA--protein transferase